MSKPKILVTGGPVAANLDAVKLITNRFKGGRMMGLAHSLGNRGANVTYLASELPKYDGPLSSNVEWIKHSGFDHYMNIVQVHARDYNVIVLGAAVANLIPDKRWQELMLKDGKFPSHNYEEDDPVPILFRIAPRIINRVREVAPYAKLVGFKLLSGVAHDELIRAAQLTQREARAHLVVANDAKNLNEKFGVTPEGGEFCIENLAETIYDMAKDKHYTSVPASLDLGSFYDEGLEHEEPVVDALNRLKDVAEGYEPELLMGKQSNGMIFGCVAVRVMDGTGRFVISARGKKNIKEATVVCRVDHEKRRLVVGGGTAKASLNAPLIDQIFKKVPDANVVVHWHDHGSDSAAFSYSLPYAQPGTVRDSLRDFPVEWGDDGRIWFAIAGHGEFRVMK